MWYRTSLILLALQAWGCQATPSPAAATSAVAAHLDAWHLAASRADEAGYFGALAEQATFLGTDKSEHWTKAEFHAYAAPHFAKGQGWTYVPRDRQIRLSPDQSVAWFDERLDNAKYGELRGTGVLVRAASGWEIVHYSMSFPIPNDLTQSIVEQIRREAPPTALAE